VGDARRPAIGVADVLEPSGNPTEAGDRVPPAGIAEEPVGGIAERQPG
jgi:hypothetical protein